MDRKNTLELIGSIFYGIETYEDGVFIEIALVIEGKVGDIGTLKPGKARALKMISVKNNYICIKDV